MAVSDHRGAGPAEEAGGPWAVLGPADAGDRGDRVGSEAIRNGKVRQDLLLPLNRRAHSAWTGGSFVPPDAYEPLRTNGGSRVQR